ncbi:DUF1902 domain-containing protein [Enterovirga sp.]|uniref:DUF1902 domain-containing protein n=1 Tax=Enterovirga sp. TaxID=2026350 RepID=UPI002628B00F|nr:DUF1902 domain-containing protein [Enterovirga sp.]MDB5591377.1 hypothetical protein [Enterovirga sp.]
MSGESPLRAARDGAVVRIGEHSVALAYDPDGEVWFVQASSVPGLTGSAESFDELLDDLPGLIRQIALP